MRRKFALVAAVAVAGSSFAVVSLAIERNAVESGSPHADAAEARELAPGAAPRGEGAAQTRAALVPLARADQESTGSEDALPLLPPQARRKVFMAVVPDVVACFGRAGLESADLDPAMHARLHVAPQSDGKVRVARVELVDADDAPSAFRDCLVAALMHPTIDLPDTTNGLVVTPPFAGESSEEEPSRAASL